MSPAALAPHPGSAPAHTNDIPGVDPGEHAAYTVMNAPLRAYPYEHLVVEGLFPAAAYAEMLAHLPPDDAYRAAPNGRYPQRGRLMLRGREGDDLGTLDAPLGDYWARLRDRVFGDALTAALLQRFCPALAPRLLRDCWLHAFLCRDRGGYAISPHTDTSRKLVSAIVYLPGEHDAGALGTSVCVPVRPGAPGFDTPHDGDWEGYRLAWTAPFAPNTLFAFLVSDRSLHAVRPTPVGVARDTLQFSIMMPG